MKKYNLTPELPEEFKSGSRYILNMVDEMIERFDMALDEIPELAILIDHDAEDEVVDAQRAHLNEQLYDALMTAIIGE